MLMDDFYVVNNMQQQADSLTCKVAFKADHAIFNGHFPNQPVVPGVCMMEMIKELLQLQTGKHLLLRNAPNVKFLQLITPDVQPVINISWKEEGSGYIVNASFNLDTTVLFKLNGSYETISLYSNEALF